MIFVRFIIYLRFPHLTKVKGTLKYGQQWNDFDQVIVSEVLFDKKNKLGVLDNKAVIFDAGFLLEPDKKNQGVKLNRTYVGFKYVGGYSDHLPVFTDIYRLNNR